MPPKYGSVSKCYATADGKLDNNSPSSILASPKALQEFTDLVMGFVNKPDIEEPTQETVSAEKADKQAAEKRKEKSESNPTSITDKLL